MLDCTELSYSQMADLIRAIRNEVSNRNPPFFSAAVFTVAAEQLETLQELHEEEVANGHA